MTDDPYNHQGPLAHHDTELLSALLKSYADILSKMDKYDDTTGETRKAVTDKQRRSIHALLNFDASGTLKGQQDIQRTALISLTSGKHSLNGPIALAMSDFAQQIDPTSDARTFYIRAHDIMCECGAFSDPSGVSKHDSVSGVLQPNEDRVRASTTEAYYGSLARGYIIVSVRQPIAPDQYRPPLMGSWSRQALFSVVSSVSLAVFHSDPTTSYLGRLSRSDERLLVNAVNALHDAGMHLRTNTQEITTRDLDYVYAGDPVIHVSHASYRLVNRDGALSIESRRIGPMHCDAVRVARMTGLKEKSARWYTGNAPVAGFEVALETLCLAALFTPYADDLIALLRKLRASPDRTAGSAIVLRFTGAPGRLTQTVVQRCPLPNKET